MARNLKIVVFYTLALIWAGESHAVTLRTAVAVAQTGTPAAVAVRDLNWDLVPDLVVANKTANTVTVRSNTGFPSLGIAADYAVGTAPVALVLEDLSGDGYIDIAVVNQGSNNISVLKHSGGAGALGFGAAAPFAAGATPVAIAAGLFDADAFYDLAVVNNGANTVSVLLNDGTGGFPAAVPHVVSTSPSAVAVADLNGDGFVDLAVTNQGANTVSILLGNGAGGFSAKVDYPAGASPAAIALLDVDLNGRLDIAVANSGAATVAWLSNNGAGVFNFVTTYLVGTTPVALVATDMNGDGYPDLAVANAGSSTVSVLINNRNATFAAAVSGATGTTPLAIAAANLDASLEGDNDLVTADSGANTLSFVMNDTDFQPTPFVFTDQVDAPLDTWVESDVVTLSGMAGWSKISLSSGECSVSTDGGTTWSAWSAAPTMAVTTGYKIKLRVLTASAGYQTSESRVTIGGVVDTFKVRTFADDVPDTMIFLSQDGASEGTYVVSNTITISGLDVVVALSVQGGLYSLNGGAYTNTTGTIKNGDRLALRVSAASVNGTVARAVVTVGKSSASFEVTTGHIASTATTSGGGGALGLPLLLALVLVSRLRCRRHHTRRCGG